MAESISPMDVDEFDSRTADLSLKSSKVKNIVAGGVSSDTKATPWVEKYRPQSLADVAAHRDIVDTIDKLTSENKLPHLLLYGPPGTGKTSTILAVARKLYGNQFHNMILELNASDDRGIGVVRQQIQDFASTQSFSFGAKAHVKLVLLDEADAMTKDAQFALRRVIEKYTKSTRFALICNHVNKIIPALQSRCTRFRFAPLDSVHVKERLRHVIEAEKLDVTDDGLAALVRLSNGDMRKTLYILQEHPIPRNIALDRHPHIDERGKINGAGGLVITASRQRNAKMLSQSSHQLTNGNGPADLMAHQAQVTHQEGSRVDLMVVQCSAKDKYLILGSTVLTSITAPKIVWAMNR